jgi:hypothetical protein
MRVKLPIGQYSINFNHSFRGKGKNISETTSCYMKMVQEDIKIHCHDAIVQCHPNDVMDRYLGKKLALEKLLSELDYLKKEDKEKIWNKFFAVFGFPKEKKYLKIIDKLRKRVLNFAYLRKATMKEEF